MACLWQLAVLVMPRDMVLPKGFSLGAKVEFVAGEAQKLEDTKAAARFAKYKGSTTLNGGDDIGRNGQRCAI